MPRTLITAHSGADDTPPNSLDYLLDALGTSCDAIEVDVRKDAKGQLVLAHDLEEAAHAPSLETCFDLVKQNPGDVWIHCDLKQGGIESCVYEMAKTHGLTDRLAYSGSVQRPDQCRDEAWVRDVKLFFNAEEAFGDLRVWTRRLSREEKLAALDHAPWRQQITALNMHFFFWEFNRDVLEESGMPCSLWTLTAKAQLERYLAAEVYGVTTARLRDALAAREQIQGSGIETEAKAAAEAEAEAEAKHAFG